jgi:hypothetical protein
MVFDPAGRASEIVAEAMSGAQDPLQFTHLIYAARLNPTNRPWLPGPNRKAHCMTKNTATSVTNAPLPETGGVQETQTLCEDDCFFCAAPETD